MNAPGLGSFRKGYRITVVRANKRDDLVHPWRLPRTFADRLCREQFGQDLKNEAFEGEGRNRVDPPEVVIELMPESSRGPSSLFLTPCEIDVMNGEPLKAGRSTLNAKNARSQARDFVGMSLSRRMQEDRVRLKKASPPIDSLVVAPLN